MSEVVGYRIRWQYFTVLLPRRRLLLAHDRRIPSTNPAPSFRSSARRSTVNFLAGWSRACRLRARGLSVTVHQLILNASREKRRRRRGTIHVHVLLSILLSPSCAISTAIRDRDRLSIQARAGVFRLPDNLHNLLRRSSRRRVPLTPTLRPSTPSTCIKCSVTVSHDGYTDGYAARGRCVIQK